MNRRAKRMLLCFAAGLIAIGVGIFGIFSDRHDDKTCTETVQAAVVDWESEEEYDSASETYSTSYYPIVSYDVGGQTVTARYSQSYGSEQFDVGEQIEIKYNPNAPETFVVSGEHRGTVSAYWMIPLGVVLMVAAVVQFIALRRVG